MRHVCPIAEPSGTTARQYRLATMLVPDALFDHIQQISSNVEITRGRRWLDDVVSGGVKTIAELCTRENCSVRQVNMAISLALLAPSLVKAAVEGRLPRGIGIERLRDPSTEWSRQFEALGLNPE